MSILEPAAASPAPPPRHALGLPAGSVRALLAIGVLGVLWALAYGSQDKPMPLAFLYLQFLMMLILAHYFAAHGSSMGKAAGGSSALGLPRGTVRFVLLAGYVGLAWFLFKERSELKFETPPQADMIVFLALILTGFFAGHIVNIVVKFVSGGTLPAWFQDVQAWLALLSMLGMVVLLILHVFINKTLSPERQFGVAVDVWLATLVSFYFGARS
jgi:hypothetical protein